MTHLALLATAGQLDVVAVFGFLTAILTLLCVIHPHDTRARRITLVVCLAGLSFYGFAVGAWPLACVTIMWAGTTLKKPHAAKVVRVASKREIPTWHEESRITRMFWHQA